MNHEWQLTTEHLYDANELLFSRDASFLHRTEKNGQKLLRSRGNGWVLAGIVNVHRALQADGCWERRRLIEPVELDLTPWICYSNATSRVELNAQRQPAPGQGGGPFRGDVAHPATIGTTPHSSSVDE